MCLCVYGQRGVLNLQPHIKMFQLKMAALVQLRPQQQQQQQYLQNKATKRPKIRRLRNANYNKRRRFNGNK